MKPRLVLWGNDAQDARVLIALELQAEENKVNMYTFPENVVTEEFHQKMMDEWRDGNPLDFPDPYTQSEHELSVSEGLLPEEFKVERDDVVQRAQTEWHFMVLSTKLSASYTSELNELKEKVEQLEKYDSNIWEELKSFWNKVQNQVRERNLLREHSDSLRDTVNDLFARMKELRAKLDEEFDRISKENHDSFMEELSAIEQKVADGMRLAAIFDELKALQRKFRNAKLGRSDRSKVWERLDAAFKTVKEKRFGPESANDRSPFERLQRRYNGLIAAIEKMERSIQRDRNDLEFQGRKIERTDGQLEAQIRQAKIKMIEERIRSKEEKLGEMMKTKGELEQRMENERRKEEERKKREEAKKAAEEKIKQDMKEREKALEEESDKLEKAAEAISGENTPEEKKEKTEDQPQEDTKKDQGDDDESLGEKMEDTLEAAAERVEEFAEQVEEKIEDVVEKVEDAVEEMMGEEDDDDESEKKQKNNTEGVDSNKNEEE